MSTSILVEEVGLGAAIIISEPNLTAFAQCAAMFPLAIEQDPPQPTDDVEMEPIATSMDAEDGFEPPETMNQDDDEEDSRGKDDEYAIVPDSTPEEPEIERLRVSFETEVLNEPTVQEIPQPSANSAANIVDEPLFASQTLVELSRHSWGTREPHYLRGCVWSPDGTCILAPVHRDGMHVLELPTELYAVDEVSAQRPLDILTSAVQVPENGMVYDYCWYPFMNSGAPETCCWLSSQQHGPIQMWDAFDGKLRCSYRGYDAVDEVWIGVGGSEI